MIIKKIFILSYESRLNKIFNNEKLIISSIFENFFFSFRNLNFFLKLLIYFFLFFILVINFFYIIFFFFKFKINYFTESAKILSRFPYFKKINNYIIANLLLHVQ